MLAREDVGRHNAMDKVVGARAARRPAAAARRVVLLRQRPAVVRARAEGASSPGAPILVGVGAPTSLAIELAADRGMTLAGFARKGYTNVYTNPARVT